MSVSCPTFMKQRICSVARRSLAWSLVLTGGCFLGFAAQAAESPAPPAPSSVMTNVLTLEGAIRLALDSNPELRASSGRIDAAAGRAYQAKLWSNPELDLSAEDWPVSGGRGFSDSKQTVGVAQTFPVSRKEEARPPNWRVWRASFRSGTESPPRGTGPGREDRVLTRCSQRSGWWKWQANW